ncbi:D-glycero-alpha-D-manno-heptose-1,7-bisphosphate 7-phosphatase [Streptomyces sp. NPDC059851]|uniref:D-glycero-alpha-D-manno-heptose-1,7-bisphosphate 7-phosphatase n=1 Tax=Streptomyces sp. NPDC059851 TaxID=3346971 RepID=UPI00365AC311
MTGRPTARQAGPAPAPPDPWLLDGPAARRRGAGAGRPSGTRAALPAAVFFDRDGTLIADVPYNGDPDLVAPLPTAREAVAAVRALGIPVGVVSNQSGVARGLLTRRHVEAVRARVEELLGPFAVWAVCPHGPDDGCGCRKPAPGLVHAACGRLGVRPDRTVLIGDIAADLGAARAAGARGILVPTPQTRPEETAGAPESAPDLLTAVRQALAAGRNGAER